MLLERGWVYRLSTEVLDFPKVATTFPSAVCHRGGCWGGSGSWSQFLSGNSQPQQGHESVWLLPVLCLLLIRLPPSGKASAGAGAASAQGCLSPRSLHTGPALGSNSHSVPM